MNYDFDEQCRPLFDKDKQKKKNYIDFIKELNKDNKDETSENITKEKLIEYKKWCDKF